jgi:ABC-type branched-subunit amino acid transport system substrate-binding protein
MTKILIIILSYILILFNSNLNAGDNINNLKIGLLAPFSGDNKELGNSLLLSSQLALDEINDNRIVIIPGDSGTNNPTKINIAINEFVEAGVKIIIGPTDFKSFKEIKKYNDLIFISPSNMSPDITNNIISIGVSLESQIKAIEKFIIKEKRKKTIIMYPKNQYSSFIDEKLKNIKLKNYKVFKYDPDPKILTGAIENLTNYSQRKKNLELRKKILEEKDDEASKRELNRLEQKYTLGDVNFDSIIIIDFGNNLKSVLASLVFSDVDDKKILITTVNQWFDESIFYENSVKNLYYPSINLKNFKKFNKDYFKTYNLKPNEISILAYDAIGLIYYIWKKNKKITSINDFFIKDKIKGKIGTFKFNDGKVTQDLIIYKIKDGKFIKN